MPELMSIGTFAARTGLSARTLRRYDRMGLLRPAIVDLRTGYRWYQPDQIEVACRIRELRGLDMPLAAIKTLVVESDPAIGHAHLVAQRHRLTARLTRDHDAIRTLRRLEARAMARRQEVCMATTSPSETGYRCSFCGKRNDEVGRLIAGPDGVFICNDCVAKCNEILAREGGTTTAGKTHD